MNRADVALSKATSESALKEYSASIINGGTASSQYHCVVCGLDLQTEEQARIHVSGVSLQQWKSSIEDSMN